MIHQLDIALVASPSASPGWSAHVRTMSRSRLPFGFRQLISHCPDLLELPTLCGSSITGLVSSASQMASWGSQIAIACGESDELS